MKKELTREESSAIKGVAILLMIFIIVFVQKRNLLHIRRFLLLFYRIKSNQSGKVGEDLCASFCFRIRIWPFIWIP